MAAYFFGSSALVKRYSQESGTDWVLQVLDPAAGNDLYMARITGAEVVAAIARRGRSRDLSDDQTTTAIHQFHSEFASSFSDCQNHVCSNSEGDGCGGNLCPTWV